MRLLLVAGLLLTTGLRAEDSARAIIARATLAENDAQKREIIASLAGMGDEEFAPWIQGPTM
jgi:hypothetical protein